MGIIQWTTNILLWSYSVAAFLNNSSLHYSDPRYESPFPHQTKVYGIAHNLMQQSSSIEYSSYVSLFLKNIDFVEGKRAVVEYQNGKPHFMYTYRDILNQVNGFACAIDSFDGGLHTRTFDEERNEGKFRLLGLCADNSANWIIIDLASQMSNITTVIMHAKFGMEELLHVLKETKLEWLCVGIAMAEKLVSKLPELPHLTHLIIVDNISDLGSTQKGSLYQSITVSSKKKTDAPVNRIQHQGHMIHDADDRTVSKNILERIEKLKKDVKQYGVKVIKIHELISYGQVKKCQKKKNYGNPNFVATIVYTSGTCGKPKGVMLTNKNIFHAVFPLKSVDLFQNRYNNKHFSYLPVSHIYERVNVLFALLRRDEINIWSKNIKKFTEDLFDIQPQILTGVPKVFAKIYMNIREQVDKLPKLKRALVLGVFKMRKKLPRRLGIFLNWLIPISKRIKSRINPTMDIMINGGGKIPTNVQSGLYNLMNVPMYQGYGLTESTGPIFLQREKDHSVNNIGGPISAFLRFRLQSWESYSVTDKEPKGELQIKGDSVFVGYFLNKKETSKAFTPDGFFKTGDVVRLNKNGSLSFLDRSKSLIKLSQGEYIETETLNNVYSEVPFINHCVVYGDETMDRPIAIVSIDTSLFIDALITDGVLKDKNAISQFKNGTLKVNDAMVNTAAYISYVKDKMLEVYNQTTLNQYNVIDDIYLCTEAWTTEDYLTHTFKLRRFRILKDFEFFIHNYKRNKGIKVSA